MKENGRQQELTDKKEGKARARERGKTTVNNSTREIKSGLEKEDEVITCNVVKQNEIGLKARQRRQKYRKNDSLIYRKDSPV